MSLLGFDGTFMLGLFRVLSLQAFSCPSPRSPSVGLSGNPSMHFSSLPSSSLCLHGNAMMTPAPTLTSSPLLVSFSPTLFPPTSLVKVVVVAMGACFVSDMALVRTRRRNAWQGSELIAKKQNHPKGSELSVKRLPLILAIAAPLSIQDFKHQFLIKQKVCPGIMFNLLIHVNSSIQHDFTHSTPPYCPVGCCEFCLTPVYSSAECSKRLRVFTQGTDFGNFGCFLPSSTTDLPHRVYSTSKFGSGTISKKVCKCIPLGFLALNNAISMTGRRLKMESPFSLLVLSLLRGSEISVMKPKFL